MSRQELIFRYQEYAGNFGKQINKTVDRWDKEDFVKFMNSLHITTPNGSAGMYTILSVMDENQKRHLYKK